LVLPLRFSYSDLSQKSPLLSMWTYSNVFTFQSLLVILYFLKALLPIWNYPVLLFYYYKIFIA
jgi:hypothetical protein